MAALNFPFAKYKVMGFTTQGHSETTKIVRFPAKVAVNMAPWVTGLTPLHHAVKIAANELSMSSESTRHLLVLTDGCPTVSSYHRNGNGPMEEIGETVEEARRRGIHTTALAIGAGGSYDVGEKDMRAMFGRDRKNWGFVDADKLGDSLIEIVKHSFQKFLKAS
jgi:nitric oxide reductase activation protein